MNNLQKLEQNIGYSSTKKKLDQEVIFPNKIDNFEQNDVFAIKKFRQWIDTWLVKEI